MVFKRQEALALCWHSVYLTAMNKLPMCNFTVIYNPFKSPSHTWVQCKWSCIASKIVSGNPCPFAVGGDSLTMIPFPPPLRIGYSSSFFNPLPLLGRSETGLGGRVVLPSVGTDSVGGLVEDIVAPGELVLSSSAFLSDSEAPMPALNGSPYKRPFVIFSALSPRFSSFFERNSQWKPSGSASYSSRRPSNFCAYIENPGDFNIL